ncbi:hypothetical protein D3C84_815650 [compost metagenome]
MKVVPASIVTCRLVLEAASLSASLTPTWKSSSASSVVFSEVIRPMSETFTTSLSVWPVKFVVEFEPPVSPKAALKFSAAVVVMSSTLVKICAP